MAAPIKAGDRVAYTRNALLTLGGKFGSRRGIVLVIVEHSPGWTLATVQWEGEGGFSSGVNVKSLCRTNSKAFVE